VRSFVSFHVSGIRPETSIEHRLIVNQTRSHRSVKRHACRQTGVSHAQISHAQMQYSAVHERCVHPPSNGGRSGRRPVEPPHAPSHTTKPDPTSLGSASTEPIPNYCLASPTPTRLAAGGAHCHQRVAAPAVCLLPGHSAALHSVLGRRVASALALLPPRSLPRQRPAPTFRTLDGGNLPCGEGLDRLLLLGRLGPIQRCPACVVALSQVRSNPEQR